LAFLELVEQAELLDVLRYFDEMPEEQIHSKPWLCIAYAWVKANVDPSGGMDRILQQAESGLAGVEDLLDRQRLVSHLDAIRAYIAWVKGESDKALEFARSALKGLPENDWLTLSHVLTIEGAALQYLDHLPEAARSFDAAIIAGQKAGRSLETFFAYTGLAFVNTLQGRLHQSFSNCQHVLRLAEESGQVSSRMPVLAHTFADLSMVKLEWNEVESAITYAREAVTLAEGWKQADALHFSLTCLSKALCAASELEEAFAVNHRAMQLAVKVSPWFIRISACNEIRLNLVKGDLPLAARRFGEVELLIEEKLVRGGTFLVTKVSLLYAQSNYQDVIAALEGLPLELEQSGKYWTLMNVLPIQALALQALGREEEALNVIGHCLTLAKPEGYVRIFVDQGVDMARLLQFAASRGIETDYVNELLSAFNIQIPSGVFEIPSHPKVTYKLLNSNLREPLSEREMEVLRFLNTRLSVEEISQELYVAPSTIRTHVRNIYGKLGVHNRIEAIQKASELSLI
jgi:LuxR family maltose regulon positive regulatory protein